MSHQEEEQLERQYDRLDSTLSLVTRTDDLDPMSSDDTLRALMSCGHAVSPESVADWCRSQLDQGIFKFRCCALVDGNKRCNKEWSYPEVRRLADLSVEEMQHFEETIARLAAEQYCDGKQCPQCKTHVERKDLSNLCVRCTICTADKKKTYQFCWQCLREWKGPGPRSDRCDNNGCTNQDLQLVRTCVDVNLHDVRGVDACPSIRLCPTCGLKIEHNRSGCKNVICPRCRVEFCFVCLKLTPVCLKSSTYFIPCIGGVAPRQTTVPVWNRQRRQ
ncbi:uncharacterized protein LOC114451098 [Parambassis ranga]|uniref:Uncharacterized protein LOC114451098 n=1 Tax=Parambassis ranga TaxID=210632 RepID=A0A6P7K7R1_9TELE|nr:uncharacterized protein LOC114451098 [Parambassis ranga]XP_028285445.1 uncharacterized protein LOC114451098 [Parambassis ranga]